MASSKKNKSEEPIVYPSPDAPIDIWCDMLTSFITRLKKKRGVYHTRFILRWLNGLAEVNEDVYQVLWHVLKKHAHDVSVAQLLLEIIVNVRLMGTTGHRLTWIYEFICAEIADTIELLNRYERGEVTWDACRIALRHVRLSEFASDSNRKGQRVLKVVYGFAAALSVEEPDRRLDALRALLAAHLDEAGNPAKKVQESDPHLWSEVILHIASSPISAKVAAFAFWPIWNRFEPLVKAASEDRKYIRNLQASLQEEQKKAAGLREELARLEEAIRDIEGECATLREEFQQAQVISEQQVSLTIRDAEQRFGRVIGKLRRNLDHDLREIEIAIEGLVDSADAQIALRRLVAIRKYLGEVGTWD